MKKVLMGTTALVAAVAAVSVPTTASANEPIRLEIRGYSNQGVAYADADWNSGLIYTGNGAKYTYGSTPDYNEINFGTDSEIHFLGETSLDNGLTIGVHFELELENDNDVASFYSDLIDEAFIQAQNGWGRVQFGQVNSALYQSHVGAPNIFASHGVSQPDRGLDPFSFLDVPADLAFFPFAIQQSAAPQYVSGNPINTTADFTGDSIKINYFTPSFNGLQFGLSYTPNPCKNDTGYSSCVYEEFGRHFWEAVAFWSGEFNNVGLAFSAGFGQGNAGDESEEPSQYQLGGEVSFGGFVIGASFAEKDMWGTGDDQEHFDVGITYSTGPWAFGLQYGDGDGNLYGWDASDGSGDYWNSQDEAESWLAGVTYDYGPGMQLGFGVQTLDVEDGWYSDDGDYLNWSGYDGFAAFFENSITF